MTGLRGGCRVAKDSPVVEALGEIDELGCVLALAALHMKGREAAVLREVQGDLMGLSADLALPERRWRRLVGAESVAHLDSLLVAARRGVPPARGFVLPGGPAGAAFCHLARAVARRAERRVAAIPARMRANSLAIPYLNRLSDLLFVMARAAARRSGRERVWVHRRPG
jgi:cob(I)alamin adenosyltransferase